ncbi:hypothetical protein Q6U52_000870 [Vibrio alginolyticus]|nr:hypothetical protein [Vibrio alginolyticus]
MTTKTKGVKKRGAPKSKGNNEAKIKKAQERQEQYKLKMEDDFINYFSPEANAKRENYLYSNKLSGLPKKVTYYKGDFDKEQLTSNFGLVQSVGLDTVISPEEMPKIPVFITSANLKNIVHDLMEEMNEEHNLGLERNKDGDVANVGLIFKDQKSKGSVISRYPNFLDTVDNKWIKGVAALEAHKKRLKKLKVSDADIEERIEFKKLTYTSTAYFAIEDFKDILPKSFIDKIPEFKLQDALSQKIMTPSDINVEAKVKAEVLKVAMTKEHGSRISFKDDVDTNTIYCQTVGRDISTALATVFMADDLRFKSQVQFLTGLTHETGHAVRVLTPNTKVGKTNSDGINPEEEVVAELTAYKVSKELGFPHLVEEHAAYVIENIGKDLTLLKKLEKLADERSTVILDAYHKHDTPELRQEITDKFEAKIRERYDDVEVEEIIKNNKQKLRA